MKRTVRTCIVCTLSLTTTHAFVAPSYNLCGISFTSRLQCSVVGARSNARPTGVLSLRAKVGICPLDEVSPHGECQPLLSVLSMLEDGVCIVMSWLFCCVDFSVCIWWNLRIT